MRKKVIIRKCPRHCLSEACHLQFPEKTRNFRRNECASRSLSSWLVNFRYAKQRGYSEVAFKTGGHNNARIAWKKGKKRKKKGGAF